MDPASENKPEVDRPSTKRRGKRTKVRIRIPADPVARRQFKRERLLSRVKLVCYYVVGFLAFCFFIYYTLGRIPRR